MDILAYQEQSNPLLVKFERFMPYLPLCLIGTQLRASTSIIIIWDSQALELLNLE